MLKVAAYCRVSTDKDDQLNSLENQKRYFEEYIKRNENWEFFNLYIDEGISGTNIKKRNGFKQMIADAEKRKFDLLVTKEISRFARNTLDSILYTRKLKSLGIGVVFLNDNINTLDPDSELRLTIMASIAQEESRKTSERVKWGQKRSMESGKAFGNRIYGYDIKKGKLFVNEEEAKVIQLIYNLYLEDGMGTHVLAKELENRGIKSPSGHSDWTNASLLKILKNEKYIGVLKQKKQITTDFLAHSRKRNEGEEDFIILENNHEPIIEKRIFEAVQREIHRRSTYKFDKSKYSNRYAWSGKLECGNCGAKFKRKIWQKEKDFAVAVWQCTTNYKYGREALNKQNVKVGCNVKAVHESVLEYIFLSVLNDLVKDKDEIISNLENAVLKVLEGSNCISQVKDIQSQMDRISKRKHRLLDLYSDETISKQEFKEKNEGCNLQMKILNGKLQGLNRLSEKFKENRELISKIRKTINNIVNCHEFNAEVCKQLLSKIIVHDRNNYTVLLNGNIDKKAVLTDSEYTALSVTHTLLLKEQYKLQWKKCR